MPFQSLSFPHLLFHLSNPCSLSLCLNFCFLFKFYIQQGPSLLHNSLQTPASYICSLLIFLHNVVQPSWWNERPAARVTTNLTFSMNCLLGSCCWFCINVKVQAPNFQETLWWVLSFPMHCQPSRSIKVSWAFIYWDCSWLLGDINRLASSESLHCIALSLCCDRGLLIWSIVLIAQ